MQKIVTFIGAELGWGAGWPEVELGPSAMKEAGLLKQYTFEDNVFVKASESAVTAGKKSFEERMILIKDFNQRLADLVEKVCRQQHFPLIMGGDHAIAMGTWQGVRAGTGHEKLGLLWIDAHLDAHTPETTPSHNIHGMPIATLLGYGDEGLATLKGIWPTLQPENIAMIGIRSADPGETELVQSLGVRVFSMSEIKDRGIEEVMVEAKAVVTEETDGFGMSVDVDGFDPYYAPGTGTPEVDGLDPNTLIPLLAAIAQDPNFCALEIAEYNPKRDNENKITQKLVERLVKDIMFSK